MVEKFDGFPFSPLAVPTKDALEDLFVYDEFLVDNDTLQTEKFNKGPLRISCEVSHEKARPFGTPANEDVVQKFLSFIDSDEAYPGNMVAFSPLAGVDLFSATQTGAVPLSIPQVFINSQPATAAVERALELPSKPAAVVVEKKSKKKTAEKKAEAKKMVPVEAPKPIDPSRTWKTVFMKKEFQAADVSIKIKTRRDKPSEEIPQRMYSSLKYVLLQSATGFSGELPFILARIKVVDAETHEVILKNNKDVLKGVIESALTRPPRSADNVFEGSLNCQFTDLSYHVDKREICYEISYFTPEDLENPVMIKRSAPFKNFARKPNKKRSSKRKRDEDAEEDEDEMAEAPLDAQPKKQKVAAHSVDFEDFSKRLEDLVEFNKKLGQNDKRRAMDLILNKLLQIDPVYAVNILNTPSMQPAAFMSPSFNL